MSNSAKMSAKQRIEALVDENSFVEIGGLITKRNTDFNMQQKAVPADGVITGYGVIDSNLVYVYSQDVTAMGGSVGEMHAKKIAGLYEMAVKAGAPVIELIDCAGIRVQEAFDALAGFGEIYMAKVKASGIIPQISAVLGSCGGGVAVASKLSDITLMDAENGKLFVNSPNAVTGQTGKKNVIRHLLSSRQRREMQILYVTVKAKCFLKIRELIGLLPANAGASAEEETADDMNRMLDGFDAYKTDAAEALTQIADENRFIQLKETDGPEMVVGLMKHGRSNRRSHC